MANVLTRLLPKKLRPEGKTIPVIRLHGVIASGGSLGRPALNLASVAGVLEKAFAYRNAPAIAVSVNSPGGSPVQSRLIFRRIRDLAKEKDKKVIVFVEDAAASGGYMIACAGDEIIADPSSIVGSIGVISAGFGFPDLIERFGIERRVYATGQRKGMLDPFQDEKSEDVDRLHELHEDIFENFKTYVRDRRGDRLKAAEDTLFTGDIWTGNQALEVGLIDGLAEMRSEMRRRYGDKVKFQRAEVRRGLLSRLRGGGMSAIDPAELVSALDDWALWKRYGL